MVKEEKEEHPQYVTIKTYAELCGVGVHNIYARLKKSDDGTYAEGHEAFLESCHLTEAEGEFIDTNAFPPSKIRNRKRKDKDAA
jgi:hypothetical protein